MLKEIIRKHVIANAHAYGKADKKSIVGKVIAEEPEAKRNMKLVLQNIDEAIGEVDKWGKERIAQEYEKLGIKKEKKEEEKRLVLPDAQKGKVVTRFAPEPNGYLHIGHAKAMFLSYESSRTYEGKCFLRFDDTNPEKEGAEYVDAIKEDSEWLGVKFDGEYYTSDYMEKLYEYGKQLIEKNLMYACTCSQQEIGRNREEKKVCACRRRSTQENLGMFEKMKRGEEAKGFAIMRLRGKMESENTVMRDPAMFRIIASSHFRQKDKYILWPTYDYSVSIMDSMLGITHALRSKEYELRDELYYYVLELLGLRKPFVFDFARLDLKGYKLSKRFIKPLIDEKKVKGWDDPRLPTLKGLKRRGILPSAIKSFVLSFGLSKTESEPEIDRLLIENRKLLEPAVRRYFFIPHPVLLSVENGKKQEIRIRLHPEKDFGLRKLEVENEFYIPLDDVRQMKEGETFRLKDLYNVQITKINGNKVNGKYAGDDLIEKTKKIQWVPVKESIPARVLIPKEITIVENGEERFNENSLETVEGVCEKNCQNLKERTTIQFERFGFCTLDEKDGILIFIYI